MNRARTACGRAALAALLCGGMVAAALAVPPPSATAATTGVGAQLSLVHTYTSVQNGWSKVELWQDNDSAWPAEHYLPDGRDDQTGQPKTLFGAGEPPGSEFLLYQAPGALTNNGRTVLLVMGPTTASTVNTLTPG